MKIILSFLIILLSFSLIAQTTPLNPDYTAADRHAKSLKLKKIRSLQELADSLTRPFSDDFQKARVIYTWMAYNIRYDCLARHRLRKSLKKPLDIAQKGRAICEGYSILYAELCSRVGVPCNIITGYQRTDYDQIGKPPKKPLHAWNLVMLNRKWYFVDPTWAAGFTNKKCTKFTQNFNENWFFVAPEQFIYSHFPLKKTDQGLDTIMAKNKFQKAPFPGEGFTEYKIKRFKPDIGTVKGKVGDTLNFSFETQSKYQFQMATISTDDGTSVQMTPKNNVIKYTLRSDGKYFITIALDGTETITYKAIIKKNPKIQKED